MVTHGKDDTSDIEDIVQLLAPNRMVERQMQPRAVVSMPWRPRSYVPREREKLLHASSMTILLTSTKDVHLCLGVSFACVDSCFFALLTL